MNITNDDVINLLKSTDREIYLVGGSVRDLLLGKQIHDRDIIVCDMFARDFAKKFADENNATFIELDSTNNIYRVVMPDKINYVDITNPINNSIEEDLKRRDITINSIALNINTNEIIDLVGGQDDLKKRIIKIVSEKNIVDDYLRMLRVFRFASVLGFQIEDYSLSVIKKHYKKIIEPAIERRNSEIIKLFGGRYADKILLIMNDIGLIELLFPPMEDVKKVPSNSHHHLDLFHHSVETVRQIQEIYENSQPEVKEHLEKIDFGGDTRLAHLKFGGFLHDIGKYKTWTIEGNRHRFIKHEEVGENIADEYLKKNKFSKKQIDYIKCIIRNHIYPSQVISAPNITDKIYMRYIRKVEDNSIDLITVAKADRLSALGVDVTEEMVANNISGLNKLLQFYIDIKPSLKPLPKLLTGNEIMDLKNIKPSKELGKIIDALKEAQIDGAVLTKEDAIKFVMSQNIG